MHHRQCGQSPRRSELPQNLSLARARREAAPASECLDQHLANGTERAGETYSREICANAGFEIARALCARRCRRTYFVIRHHVCEDYKARGLKRGGEPLEFRCR